MPLQSLFDQFQRLLGFFAVTRQKIEAELGIDARAGTAWASTRLELAAQVGSDVPLFLIGQGSYFLQIRSVSVLIIPHRHPFAGPQHRFWDSAVSPALLAQCTQPTGWSFQDS